MFKKSRFTSARKRQREKSFDDLTPVKRGRFEISEELKQKIKQVWISNSRPAAKLMVCNPQNRNDRRPGRRLCKPALQIMLQCPLVNTKYRQSGEISTTTFRKYRPW